MSKLTLTERMMKIETKFDDIVLPMASQVHEINKILNSNGLVGKVEKACEDINNLRKNHNGDNGKERRKNTFQRMPLYQKVITAGAILAILFRPEVATLLHVAADWLQKITGQ